MGALATAPGVIGAASTTYVTAKDVKILIGCKDNTAYKIIRELNNFAKETGKFAYVPGKASKYIFSDKFGIPMDVINTVIEQNQKGR